MQEILDVDALMKAAAQAARRNDTGEAAALLRRIVAIQEQSLGPGHVELAPSLNNLALMLEQEGETVEAERCYRRAYDIARRAVGAEDPMAQAARGNLVAFLHATGKLDPLRDDIEEEHASDAPMDAPVHRDEPAARLTLDAPPAARAGVPSPPAPVRSTPSSRPPPGPVMDPPADRARVAAQLRPVAPEAVVPRAAVDRAGRQRLTTWMLAAAAAAGIVAWLVFGGVRPTSPDSGAGEGASPSRAEPVALAPGPPPAAEPAPTAAPAPPPGPPPGPAPAKRPLSPNATTPLSADASLCRRLDRSGGSWRCQAPPESGPTDAVYFYTRIKTPRDMVVRHRWTYEGKTVQTINLRIRANPREGYRTFSHQRLAGRAGQWEVSLLGDDGSVVASRQFTVASQGDRR